MDIRDLLFDVDLNINGIINAALHLAEPINQINNHENEDHNEGEVLDRNVARNTNYFEITIPNYTDHQFPEHFRMSRQTFQLLLNRIGQLYQGEATIIPLEKKLLFTIWILSKSESFLAVGDRFNLSKSSGHRVFVEVIELICQLLPEYVRWPDNHLHTINVFRNRSGGIPGIRGAIDGCHITIKQPLGNAIDYFNRKQVHSIILQGTCNEQAVFTDVNIGQPGRMHDARVFRLSPLYDRLTDVANPILPPNQHLVGDAAYPLMMNLMKPFQNNGHLTAEQHVFNVKLSSVRSTFGLLKVKFRRLKYLDVQTPEMAVQITAATCILHNFILLQGNAGDDYNIDNIDIEVPENNRYNEDEYPNDGRRPAELKRQNLVNLCARN